MRSFGVNPIGGLKDDNGSSTTRRHSGYNFETESGWKKFFSYNYTEVTVRKNITRWGKLVNVPAVWDITTWNLGSDNFYDWGLSWISTVSLEKSWDGLRPLHSISSAIQHYISNAVEKTSLNNTSQYICIHSAQYYYQKSTSQAKWYEGV